MKLLYIIGCGMGPGSLTGEGAAALSEAQVVMGTSRQLKLLSRPNQESFPAYRKDEVDKLIRSSDKTVFALLVSGDTGFFSSAASYSDNSGYWVRCIAGVSTVSYFFAKCRLPWQNAKLLSAHDGDCQAVDAVRRNRLTFLLTGGNVGDLARELCEAGFSDLLVHVGESLGAADETTDIMPLSDLCSHSCSPMTVLIIENPYFDRRLRAGIPDEEFLCADSIPMSRSHVRAAIMSAFSPSSGDVCWDVGCGSGSVTVELALAAYEGHVYALDKSEDAVELTRENCRSFQIGNVSAAAGLAPYALEALPAPDNVFIGGGIKNAAEIIHAALQKNSLARIVTTATSPQGAVQMTDALESAGLSAAISQLSYAHSAKGADRHTMHAETPVFVISAGGRNG